MTSEFLNMTNPCDNYRHCCLLHSCSFWRLSANIPVLWNPFPLSRQELLPGLCVAMAPYAFVKLCFCCLFIPFLHVVYGIPKIKNNIWHLLLWWQSPCPEYNLHSEMCANEWVNIGHSDVLGIESNHSLSLLPSRRKTMEIRSLYLYLNIFLYICTHTYIYLYLINQYFPFFLKSQMLIPILHFIILYIDTIQFQLAQTALSFLPKLSTPATDFVLWAYLFHNF